MIWIIGITALGFYIDVTLGITILVVMLGGILGSAVFFHLVTKDIDYVEILKVKPIYKRGHRYMGSSMGWFEGQPVAHYAYGKWPAGTKVRVRIHYLPGAIDDPVWEGWCKVGDYVYNKCITRLEGMPKPPVKAKKVRSVPVKILRVLGHVIAWGLVLMTILDLIVAAQEWSMSIAACSLIFFIPAIILFCILVKT